MFDNHLKTNKKFEKKKKKIFVLPRRSLALPVPDELGLLFINLNKKIKNNFTLLIIVKTNFILLIIIITRIQVRENLVVFL